MRRIRAQEHRAVFESFGGVDEEPCDVVAMKLPLLFLHLVLMRMIKDGVAYLDGGEDVLRAARLCRPLPAANALVHIETLSVAKPWL